MRDWPIRPIVVPGEPDFASPLTGEKMTPVLSRFTVEGDEEGFALCRALVAHQGAGHTAIVHSGERERVTRFGTLMPASRILVNSTGAHGASGFTTGLIPSRTLGRETFGGNSTPASVTCSHLVNIKRLAPYTAPEQIANASRTEE